jgi:serine/threonine protein kinase
MQDANVIGPGSMLGRYELRRELGRGHVGRVFLADHAFTRDVWAVKVLHDTFKDDQDVLSRFIMEGCLAKTFHHPNIVRVGDIDHSDGVWFMALEYCDGGTLAELMAQNRGLLPPGAVVSVGCQLGSALRFLHGKGIIHRDVKPENVMLVWNGASLCARLTDLGVASVDERLRRSDTPPALRIAGTRGYMSPAQLCGERVETTDDLYSLGVMLYELATGMMPWQLEGEPRDDYWRLTMDALYQRQTATRVVDPRRHVPTMRRGFAEALVWPLAVLPSNRSGVGKAGSSRSLVSS